MAKRTGAAGLTDSSAHGNDFRLQLAKSRFVAALN
jgi:hypothetical protein